MILTNKYLIQRVDKLEAECNRLHQQILDLTESLAYERGKAVGREQSGWVDDDLTRIEEMEFE